jgi:hypothetical protein
MMGCKNLIRFVMGALIGLGMLTALAGCAPAQDTPTATPSPIQTTHQANTVAALEATATSTAATTMPTLTPIPGSTPTATVTSGPSSTHTPPVPTPDFLQLPFANNVLFAPAADPECQLPCWQGLRVGESNRDDIQAMFELDFVHTPRHRF